MSDDVGVSEREDGRPGAEAIETTGDERTADDAIEALDGIDTVNVIEATEVGLEATEVGLEAVLFVAERPLSRREIGQLLGIDREAVDRLLGDLEVTLSARGVRLVTAGEHVALATAPEAGRLVARYIGAEPARLSPASQETLAIVAYRQPVTRSVVDRIRGVDSDYTLRTLLHRRLIVELGRSDAPGRPILYGTGIDFLERFGLVTLDDLAPLEAEIAGRLVDLATSAEPAPDIATPMAPADA
jgi:segregation and condensation protein B